MYWSKSGLFTTLVAPPWADGEFALLPATAGFYEGGLAAMICWLCVALFED